jgi:hypothetical protein
MGTDLLFVIICDTFSLLEENSAFALLLHVGTTSDTELENSFFSRIILLDLQQNLALVVCLQVPQERTLITLRAAFHRLSMEVLHLLHYL